MSKFGHLIGCDKAVNEPPQSCTDRNVVARAPKRRWPYQFSISESCQSLKNSASRGASRRGITKAQVAKDLIPTVYEECADLMREQHAYTERREKFPAAMLSSLHELRKKIKNFKSWLERTVWAYEKDIVQADAIIRLAKGRQQVATTADGETTAHRRPNHAAGELNASLARCSVSLYEWYVHLLKETCGRVGFSLACCIAESVFSAAGEDASDRARIRTFVSRWADTFGLEVKSVGEKVAPLSEEALSDRLEEMFYNITVVMHHVHAFNEAILREIAAADAEPFVTEHIEELVRRPVPGINIDESPVWRLDFKEKIVVPKHYATTPDGDPKKRLIAEPTAATRQRGGPA